MDKHVFKDHHIKQMKASGKKASRIVYLCIAVVYLAVAVGATVYAQTVYVKSLPTVTLGQVNKGKMPEEWLVGNETTGYVLNTVEQQDGPWGKQYAVRQVSVYNYKKLEDGMVIVFDAMDLKFPIVTSTSAEFLYDGQQVRLTA